MKHILILTFPGTNCEHETASWFADNLNCNVEFLALQAHGGLHKEEIAAIVLPGGFSYGDYLRAGAIAARSPELRFVKLFANLGVPVLGICNGFQILCESGLLPGVLLRNVTKQHHHFPVRLHIEPENFAFQSQNAVARIKSTWLPEYLPETAAMLQEQYANFLLPISCSMGNWHPPRTSTNIIPLLRYIDNENGSHEAIAGIMNAQGNILGMMPHPERASDPLLGSTAGLIFLLGIAQSQNIGIKSGSHLAAFKNSQTVPASQAQELLNLN